MRTTLKEAGSATRRAGTVAGRRVLVFPRRAGNGRENLVKEFSLQTPQTLWEAESEDGDDTLTHAHATLNTNTHKQNGKRKVVSGWKCLKNEKLRAKNCTHTHTQKVKN